MPTALAVIDMISAGLEVLASVLGGLAEADRSAVLALLARRLSDAQAELAGLDAEERERQAKLDAAVPRKP